jgi:hypothetical protein
MDEGATEGNYTYVLSGDRFVLTGYGKDDAGVITVP